MCQLRVPIVGLVTGEGNSGGALAIGVADRIFLLENAYFSVVSPEGCASILWRSSEQAKEAAEALKLTAEDLLKLGIIDEVVVEPLGGAHRDRARAIESLGDAIDVALTELCRHDGARLRAERREKFLAMGSKGLN
jgi:acetyl-CoA carboxylase carboxyl transferase subunit alpha